ncbi:MAG: hypothetical protein B6D65_02965 [candidate division Zixibacteria bacterium 4484_93]|nr:MAG: hypothetical protein B6D65_02965 [candidate division Zixibacteria bacterium 4484_93]
MKRVIIISLFLLFAGRLTSGVRLEGYYENTNTLDGNIRWYLAEPHHNIEFRFLGQPMGGVEAFLKFHAESDKLFNNNLAQRYTLYDMVEAHARFRWEKGLEFVLFSRENRFWFPQGLMELVSQWTVNDNGNAQGVRADFWNIWKLHGLFIYSDYSQSGGEDATITRWSLPLLSDRFRLSSTFARKDWNGSSDNHNDVVSSDIYFSLGRTLSPLRHFGDFDCALELARSRIPDEDKDSKNTALKAEIRNLRVGPVEIKFAYREIGENFRSYLSSDYDQGQKYNESGYNINATYFFPTKAVNITTNYEVSWLGYELRCLQGLSNTFQRAFVREFPCQGETSVPLEGYRDSLRTPGVRLRAECQPDTQLEALHKSCECERDIGITPDSICSVSV